VVPQDAEISFSQRAHALADEALELLDFPVQRIHRLILRLFALV